MPSVEQTERIGGAALLGIPAFDFFVWALDNYARLELLVKLQSQLPQFLFSPAMESICLFAGLGLFYSSHRRQLGRLVASDFLSRRLVDTSGTTIIHKEKPGWLLPICVVFALALIATPLLAISYSLAYKGSAPKVGAPEPPVIAYLKTPRPQPVLSHPPSIAVQQTGQNNIAQVGNNNKATINAVPPPRKLSEEQKTQMIEVLSAARHELTIGSLIGDEEAADLATSLADTFEKSAWTVQKLIGRQWQDGRSAEAITLSLYAPLGTTGINNETAKMVVDALRTAGLKVAVNFDETLKPESVNLFVGARRTEETIH